MKTLKILGAVILLAVLSWAQDMPVKLKFLTASGAPAVGVTTVITITPPKGKVISATVITDSTGTASYNYKLAKNAPLGTYKVSASAKVSGKTYTGSTTFVVN